MHHQSRPRHHPGEERRNQTQAVLLSGAENIKAIQKAHRAQARQRQKKMRLSRERESVCNPKKARNMYIMKAVKVISETRFIYTPPYFKAGIYSQPFFYKIQHFI